MYEEFYGLTERPFSIQPDPDFLYLSNRHSMAYAMLQYGITNRAGFTVICGDIGCGKTTLVRHVLNNIEDDVTVGIVYNTHKDVDDLLGWIMLAFGQSYDGLSDIALFDAFQQYLISSYIEGQRLVLIIDEAQNLTKHEVKTILTRVGEGSKIVLMGDPEQIDHPYLDAFNNGLTYVVERFKDQQIAGHVKLVKGERSGLAQLAADLL